MNSASQCNRGEGSVSRRARTCVIFAALGAVAACEPKSHNEAYTANAVTESPESIPAAALNGSLLGTAFTVQSARYWIDRRVGYEKIDVRLSSSKSAAPCAEPNLADAPSVWLRRTGTTRVNAETVRLHSSDAGPWEVHYQVMAHEQWIGVGKAEALLVLHEPRADKRLPGEAAICFADETKSCVQGSFLADYCQLSIDAPVRGTQLMETPVAGQHPATDEHEASLHDAGVAQP